MKRFLSLFIPLMLILLLCSCGKSEAAQNVDDMISALGVVDENSKTVIEEAEAAYNALSDRDKGALENYAQLEEARSTFDRLMADKAIGAISQIGFVDEDSWNDIQIARKIYDGLSDSEKQLVSNYSNLVSAEEQYLNIKIAPVEELIMEIPTFDSSDDALPDGFAKTVESATEAYEGLDEELKEKVSNREKLTEATEYLSDFRVSHLIAYITENLSEVGFDSGMSLYVANTSYEMLSDADKARITNYDVLKTAQEKFDSLVPIQLNSYTLGQDLIGRPTLKISATNITDFVIKEYSVCIFAFDSDGVPVKVDRLSWGDGFSSVLRDTDALKPGATTKSNSYWQLDADYNEMKQFVVLLKNVKFYDGTTWQNSQYDTLFEKYNGQILSADDKNILPTA